MLNCEYYVLYLNDIVLRNKYKYCIYDTFTSSGLLTGKHKREVGVPVEGTRIEASTKKTGFTGPAAPDFNEYKDNEQYWKIDELLHSLAQKYGAI